MTYDEWEGAVGESVKRDATWHVQAYRFGLYLARCAWKDCERLASDPRGASAAGQLIRAVGSIAANVAEGYAKRSAKDRIRYFEYALGSVGETRAWYLVAEPSLTGGVVDARCQVLLSLTRLLLTMIRRERGRTARPLMGEERRRRRGEP